MNRWVVLSFLFACGGDDRPVASLDDVPEARLDQVQQFARGDDVAMGLSSVWATAVDESSRLYVVDGKEAHVRVFDSTGAHLVTLGRRGSGPGEFEVPLSVGTVGDSVWVLDSRNRRMTFFSRDGRYLGSIPAPAPGVGTGRLNVTVRAAIPRRNGTVVSAPVMSSYQTDAPSDSLRIPRLLFDTAGKVVDTLQWFMQHDLRARLVTVGSSWAAIRPRLFTAHPIEAEVGGVRVLVEQNVDSGRVTVKRLDDRGVVLQSRTFGYRPRALDARQRETAIRHMADVLFGRNGTLPPGAADRVREALEFPRMLPAISDVMVGEDGAVWLGRTNADAELGSRWIVIAPNGDLVGEVRLPENAMSALLTVRGRSAWVPISDDSGLLWVAQFRVTIAN